MNIQDFNDPSGRRSSEHTPYENYMNISLTPPPPPPPDQSKKTNWLGAISLCVIGLALVGSILYVGIAGIPWQQTSQTETPSPIPMTIPTRYIAATPTLTPTVAPTLVPAVHTPIMTGAQASYPASLIATYFYQAGLAPQTTMIDTSWSCCRYYPEGGATYWSDLQTGITMDLATFASIDEVQIDGQELTNKGFGAYVENYCLLSYEGDPSDLQSYLSIMQEECTY